ncbi:MAG: hypothetical protein JO069_23015 [Verrucomicrobia bacterium]|nr:hypothetical protein [Verrucomicrobiota bacterium]
MSLPGSVKGKEELVAQVVRLCAGEFNRAERQLRRLGKVRSLEGTPDG